MRAGFYVSIAAAALGLATCGGASCLSVLNYEPPHPFWQLGVPQAVAKPEQARAEHLRHEDYEVSIYPESPDCTLTVKDAAGKVLGKARGGLCLVSLTGEPGAAWSFEATSSAPIATIQLAASNPLFPKPLKWAAVAGMLVVLGSIMGAVVFGRAKG